jgi:hypothetical protein
MQGPFVWKTGALFFGLAGGVLCKSGGFGRMLLAV